MSRTAFRLTALTIAAAALGAVTWHDPDHRTPALTIDGLGYDRVDLRANEYEPSTQDAVTLGVHRDGGVLLTWQSRRQQAGTYGVFARHFGPDGSARTGEIRLSATDTWNQTAPSVAVHDEGTVVGTWQSLDQDGSGEGSFARRFDRDGPEFAAGTTTEGHQTQVACTPLTDGATLLAFVAAAGVDGRDSIHLRVIDADGSPHAEQVVVAASHGVQTFSHAAFEDRVVVCWAAVDVAGASKGVFLQAFDATLDPMADPVRVDATGPTAGIEPAVCVHGDGIAVTWLQAADAAANGYDVLARRFDAAARPIDDPVRLAAAAERWLSGAHVAAATDGTLVAAWNDESATGDASTITARRFDPQRGTWGDEFLPIASTSARLLIAAGRQCLSLGDDGRLAIAWSGDSGLGDAVAANLTLCVPQHLGIDLVEPVAPPPASVELVVDERTLQATHKSEALPHDPPVESKPALGPTIQAGNVGPDFGFGGMPQTTFTPPDPHLAVGPGHVVQVVNDGVAIYTKDGTQTFVDTQRGSTGFFGSVGATSFVFDPEVIWDPFDQRFIVMANERNPSSGSGRSYFLVAVSDDQDPNGVWHKYRFDVTQLANIGSGGGDIDSPNIMVDADVLYLSSDHFAGGQHHLVFMLDKTPLLTGAPVGATNSFVINSRENSLGLPVSYGTPPAQYMIQHYEGGSNDRVRIYAIQNPLTNPSTVTFDLPVPNYGATVPVPQAQTSSRITTFDARFWSCVWRDGSLWATHHEASTGRMLQRWYEIRTNGWPLSGQNPSLAQSGSIDNGPGVHTFFGSISADDQGNAVICYAQSSVNEFLSIGRNTRLAGDPPGTFRPRQLILTNSTPYFTSRWGDYSGVAPDPATARTFWYTHEFAASQSSWRTWVGRTTTRDWLTTDRESVSASAGGTVEFEFENSDEAGQDYLLIGTLSGTAPGSVLNPGGVSLPINYDGLTQGILQAVNTPTFTNFLGQLDGDFGVGNMQLNVPPGITALVGRTMHFSCATFDNTVWRFASNAVGIRFTP